MFEAGEPADVRCSASLSKLLETLPLLWVYTFVGSMRWWDEIVASVSVVVMLLLASCFYCSKSTYVVTNSAVQARFSNLTKLDMTVRSCQT